MNIPFPANEIERLNALQSLNILDTPSSEEFDTVVRIARDTFGVPIALVSLIDGERQWFKARCGIDVNGTSREHALCNFVVASDTSVVIEDTELDHRLGDDPLVTGEPHIRFYAGAPLLLRAGICVGTLCIVDTKPRSFTAQQTRMLEDLAQLVVGHLRLHQANIQLRVQAEDVLHRERAVRERDQKLRLAEQMERF